MNGEKNFLKSLGMMGPIIAAAFMIAEAFGLSLPFTQAEVSDVIMRGVEIVGVIAGIWGRFRATKTITIGPAAV